MGYDLGLSRGLHWPYPTIFSLHGTCGQKYSVSPKKQICWVVNLCAGARCKLYIYIYILAPCTAFQVDKSLRRIHYLSGSISMWWVTPKQLRHLWLPAVRVPWQQRKVPSHDCTTSEMFLWYLQVIDWMFRTPEVVEEPWFKISRIRGVSLYEVCSSPNERACRRIPAGLSLYVAVTVFLCGWNVSTFRPYPPPVKDIKGRLEASRAMTSFREQFGQQRLPTERSSRIPERRMASHCGQEKPCGLSCGAYWRHGKRWGLKNDNVRYKPCNTARTGVKFSGKILFVSNTAVLACFPCVLTSKFSYSTDCQKFCFSEKYNIFFIEICRFLSLTTEMYITVCQPFNIFFVVEMLKTQLWIHW